MPTSEEQYHEISSLLTRRASHRQYLKQYRELAAGYEEAVLVQLDAIKDLQQRLLELGYTGT
jgi:hypothetical protein